MSMPERDLKATIVAASNLTQIKEASLFDAHRGYVEMGKSEEDFMDWLGTMLVDLGVTEEAFHVERERCLKEPLS